MSATHPESRLEFTFSDDWRVIKWDDHPAFKNGLCKAGDTKSVDFVGVLFNAPWLIEVKNFRQYRIENKPRLSSGALAKEVADKVRDSIASMTWACRRAPLDERDLAPFVRSIFGWKERICVVLWLEEDRIMTAAQASAMAETIKRELTWLNPKVLVMSRDLAEKKPWQGISVAGGSSGPK
ncbi:MAG: hypothetical protein IPM54_12565 [Polyangiaceae bacterium]|nr:hypothetical protein [Polyangiaceae bacterium]